MARLRRSIALAVTAAAGLAGSAQATPTATTLEVVAGAPCGFAATGAARTGLDSVGVAPGTVPGVATLTCNPWFEYAGATPKGGPALQACGTIQVNNGTAGGLTADAVCGTGAFRYAAGASDQLYVCTYLLADGGVRALDLDGDPRNGTQCGTVARTSNGSLSARQGGLGLGIKTSVADLPWFPDPVGPDPHCAACLSGVTPLPDVILEAVLGAAVALGV